MGEVWIMKVRRVELSHEWHQSVGGVALIVGVV